MLLRGTLIVEVIEARLHDVACRAEHAVSVHDGLFRANTACTRYCSVTSEPEEIPGDDNTQIDEACTLKFNHSLVFFNVDGASATFEFLFQCTATESSQLLQVELATFVDGETHSCWFEVGNEGCCKAMKIALTFRPVELITDCDKHVHRDAYGYEIAAKFAEEAETHRKLLYPESKVELKLLHDMSHKLEEGVTRDTWRKGVPSMHRTEAWLVFSGAKDKLLNDRSEYERICHKAATDECPAKEEIDTDIPRTFGSHPVFGCRSGQDILRRVLVRYSLRNPILGYCQGLNFITALLLSVADEESTFWMLATICEELCVNYYSKSMLGAQADVRVLDELIAIRLPKLKAHLDKYGVDLCLVTASWFICIFADILPTETTFRVWDVLFLEGTPKNVVLFRFALALLKIHEESILKLSSFEKIVTGIRDFAAQTFDASLLAQTAFSEIGPISRSVTEQRRAHHTMAIGDKANHSLSPTALRESQGSGSTMRALRARLSERVNEVKENLQDGKYGGTTAARKISESVEGMKGNYLKMKEMYKGTWGSMKDIFASKYVGDNSAGGSPVASSTPLPHDDDDDDNDRDDNDGDDDDAPHPGLFADMDEWDGTSMTSPPLIDFGSPAAAALADPQQPFPSSSSALPMLHKAPSTTLPENDLMDLMDDLPPCLQSLPIGSTSATLTAPLTPPPKDLFDDEGSLI